MPTFQELLRVAQITFSDNTSGKRMHEIEKICVSTMPSRG